MALALPGVGVFGTCPAVYTLVPVLRDKVGEFFKNWSK